MAKTKTVPCRNPDKSQNHAHLVGKAQTRERWCTMPTCGRLSM